MSSALRPQGPLSPRVYWFRRAVVLAIPLVLIVVIARLLGGSSDGKDDPEAAVQLASEGAPVAAGPTAPVVEEPVEPEPEPEPVLAEPTDVCADADVAVSPSVPAGITPDGLQIDFTVTSINSPACYWTFSPTTTSVAITSGNDDIWFSRQCPNVLPTEELVLRPETPNVISMKWNLKRSDADCSRYTEWVRLGYYHVSAAAIGGEPGSVQFQLTRPPAEVVTKTVTPKPEPKKKRKKNNTSHTDAGDGVSEPNG